MSNINELNAAAYIRHLKSKKRSDLTIQSYTAWIDDLADWNHGGDITTLKKGDMEEYFGSLLEAIKDTSAGVAFRSLRAFFNWAVADEIIEASPMRGLSEPSVEDRPPDTITDDELRALLKACAGRSFEDRRDTAMFRLLCEPGTPRRAELVGIMLDGLDMRDNQVTFIGKGSRWRTIPFGVKTGRALDFYLRARAKHRLQHLPHLWLGQRGKELTIWGVRQMLLRRCAQAQVRPLHLHQFRHTSAHVWKEHGGGEEDMEALFGWTPGSKMSRVYGRSARLTRAQKAARKASLADRL